MPLLIIDDFISEDGTPEVVSVLFQLGKQRDKRRMPTMSATQYDPQEWGHAMWNSLVTERGRFHKMPHDRQRLFCDDHQGRQVTATIFSLVRSPAGLMICWPCFSAYMSVFALLMHITAWLENNTQYVFRWQPSECQMNSEFHPFEKIDKPIN